MSNRNALTMVPDTDDGAEVYRSTPDYSRTANIRNYQIDKATGEIYGEYITASFAEDLIPIKQPCCTPRTTHSPNQHLHLATINNGNVVYADFGSTIAVSPITPATPPEATCTQPKRGPKPKVRLNPNVAIIKVAIAERAHWIEQAVMAGMYIAVESSNGKLNIKPGYVWKVLTMPVISTDAIARNPTFRNHDLQPVSERYVRYLAAAGRVALGCIERHLDHHPDEQQRLETKVLTPSRWGEEFDLDETDYIDAP